MGACWIFGGFLFTFFINWVSFVVKEGKVGLEFAEAWNKSQKKSQDDTSKGDFWKMFLVLVIHMLLCDEIQLLPVSLSMGWTDGLSMAH